jgi:hypothetical protein
LLRLWLGEDLGGQISSFFVPIIVGCCLTAISSISCAQLGSLNRLGLLLFFGAMTGLLLVGGVWLGWRFWGIAGAAWGFLFSRVALIAQDLAVVRIIGAGGWLSSKTWKQVAGHLLVALGFYLSFLWIEGHSLLRLFPAGLHGILIAVAMFRPFDKEWLGKRTAATPLRRSGVPLPEGRVK